MKSQIQHTLLALALLSTFTTFYVAQLSTCFAQGTAFTYQGRLSAGGNPATGIYDLRFAIYDAEVSGNPVGVPVTNSATGVTNGLFTVTLDFGSGVFTGDARWLEIAARTNGEDAFTVLTPRQELTPAPYAVTAKSLSGTLPGSQLSGTVADSRLSTNVAMLNTSQIFGGANCFSGQVGIGVFSPGCALDVNGAIRGSIFYDRDNSAYYVDPASVSVCNDFRANVFYDPANTGFYLIPHSTSVLNTIYADIIYDRNNTSYYVDPASTSMFNEVRAYKFTASADSNYYLNPAGTNRIVQLDCNEARADIYYDRNDTSYYVDPASTSMCNDFRANVFYDRANTAYYLSPHSSSFLNTIYANDIYAGIVYDRNDSSFYLDPASVSQFNDVRANVFYDRANTAYYLSPHSSSFLNTIYADIIYDRNNTSYYVDPASTSMFNEVRANIFYDLNNTSYYVDPASTSMFNEVRANKFTASADSNYYLNPAGTNRIVQLDCNEARADIYYDRNNTSYYMDPASTSMFNDVRANIFYDLNNTSYYMDPASISMFNEVRARKFCASEDASYFLDPAGTNRIVQLDVDGPAQLRGLVRSGAETGTSEAPDPAGLVARRINSTSANTSQIVARTDTLTLERDGSNGGFWIRYPANPGYVTIAVMGMDSTGTQKNFYTTLASPGTSGTVQIYTNSQNIVHFECAFGVTYAAGQHLTQVTLSRFNADNYWSGTVISTYNQ